MVKINGKEEDAAGKVLSEYLQESGYSLKRIGCRAERRNRSPGPVRRRTLMRRRYRRSGQFCRRRMMGPTREEMLRCLEKRHTKAVQDKLSAAEVAVCGLGGLGFCSSYGAGPNRDRRTAPYRFRPGGSVQSEPAAVQPGSNRQAQTPGAERGNRGGLRLTAAFGPILSE